VTGKLAECKTCGGQVAKTAQSCPHCGQPHPVAAMLRLQLLIVGAFVLAIVIIAALMIAKANEVPF